MLLFLAAFIGLAFLFFKSKWFDSKLRKIFGQEKDADELLNQIIEADELAQVKEDKIKQTAVQMKKDLATVKKVRKTISVAPKNKE